MDLPELIAIYERERGDAEACGKSAANRMRLRLGEITRRGDRRPWTVHEIEAFADDAGESAREAAHHARLVMAFDRVADFARIAEVYDDVVRLQLEHLSSEGRR